MDISLSPGGMRRILREIAECPGNPETDMVQIELVKATALVQIMQDLNELKNNIANRQGIFDRIKA